MTYARLVLVATLATVWIIGSCSAAVAEDSTQVTPARSSDVVVHKGAFNATSTGVGETEAEKKRQQRLQRKKEKKERRRQKKLLRKKKRRERRLRKKMRRGMKGDDKSREGKNKKQKKKKKGKRRKKGKNKDKKKKNKRKRKKKNKDRKKKRKDKKRKRKGRNRRRRKNKSRKRPIVPCKTDSDCEKAGSRYCCQLMTGRCVRPRGGLKCFGSCMCNARKQTENFLCVTKKKKFEKFLAQKKLGKVTYEKPRGHCSNVTISELQDPSHRYKQIV